MSNHYERKIRPVESRKDKQKTYQEQMDQYRKAVREGFFFEAILIDYACLEDRLRYMLYYLGVISKEKDYKINGKNQRLDTFRSILHEYLGQKERMIIQSISGKRKILDSIVRFASEPDQPYPGNPLCVLLWNSLHDEVHLADIQKILIEIDQWCAYRNEIVHCLMNKNLSSLHEQVEEQAQKGNELFRRLDRQVQWVKRKKLREKMKLDL